MEKYLMIFSTIVFFGYVGAVWMRFGVLPSISESYYQTGEKPYFTLFTWGISFPMLVATISLTPVMFFACAFIMFCGTAAAFKDRMANYIHYIGATGGILLAFIALAILGNPYSGLLMVGLIALAYLLDIKNKIWWIEIVAFTLILIYFYNAVN